MRKCCFIIFFLLFARNIAIGQTQDSTIYHIEKLNWESFKVILQYATKKTFFDENAQKLVTIRDSKKFNRLLHYISQEDKSVAIHAILTKIYEPKKLLVSVRYNYKKDANAKEIPSEMIGMTFSLNNITWDIKFNDDKQPSYCIANSEILKIKEYWLNRPRMQGKRKAR
jgi:hypothetical protein